MLIRTEKVSDRDAVHIVNESGVLNSAANGLLQSLFYLGTQNIILDLDSYVL